MDQATRRELDRINRDFYDRFAGDFSDKRSRPWRGWEPLLAGLELPRVNRLRALDAGCGNGRFAPLLAERAEVVGCRLDYLGLDRSLGLLRAASTACQQLPGHYRFLAGDLLVESNPCAKSARWHLIALFGVLHHLPGADARRSLLRQLTHSLEPGGSLLISIWQFDRNPRLMGRTIPPCDHPSIDPEQLERGDYLLRWGTDEADTMRYCHLVDEEELELLLDGLPLEVTADLEDDGRDANLNRYLALSHR